MFQNNIATLKYQTSNILKILLENRDKHEAEFEEAEKVFVERYKSHLKDMLMQADAGGVPVHEFRLIVDLEIPVSYIDHYDQAIKMLELCQDKVLTMDGTSFSRYVLDKWEWSDHFANNTRAYVGGAPKKKRIRKE